MQHQNTKWRNMTTAGGVLPYPLSFPLIHKLTTIVAGTRVSKIVHGECPPEAPCIGEDLIQGVATGVIIKTLPAQYEILWDDGITSMELALDLNVQQPAEGPHFPAYSPANVDVRPYKPTDEVIVIPAPVEKVVCADKQYSILDMCIDQTVLLVAGGIALYLIVKK
jgi:hypothetical protein